MRSTKFHIVNLGCKVNRVEADTIQAALIGQGAEPVAEEAADLIIVNTCTVTAEADKKARKAVHHALAVNPVARVLVTGCAAAIDAETFASMDHRVRVVVKSDIEREFSKGPHDVGLLRTGAGFNTRVGLKVQDGCDHECTYCIVHVARGKARSMPIDDVAKEARAHFDAGVKEVVLAGIDIGAYRYGSARLPQLVTRLIEEANAACSAGCLPARIRISSIEPLNVDDELIDILADANGRVCRHLHIPLQSGSTKVLREMNRPYTADDFRALVSKLRTRIPNIALSTDIIVGFPGETEEDFRATCELVREAAFMRLHVFPYSMRKGTPAAQRADQIPPEVKRSRAALLREIGHELAERDLAGREGTNELCLVEGSTCLTESYHEIPAPTGSNPGDLVILSLCGRSGVT